MRVWDVPARTPVLTLSGHAGAVRGVHVLPDGRAVTSSDDGTVRVWDVESGRETLKFLADGVAVNAVAFADGGRLITAGADRAFLATVPGARGREHPTIAGAGHFVQEDAGEELARITVDFVAATS